MRRRAFYWIAAAATFLGLVIPMLVYPDVTRGQLTAPEAARLVETFRDALNKRDGNLLASLYRYPPNRPCTDLDVLVFNEVSSTMITGESLTLERLRTSRASLIGNPLVRGLSDEESSIIFGLTWTYLLPDEEEERSLTVTIRWRVKKQDGVYRVFEHETRAVGSGSNC